MEERSSAGRLVGRPKLIKVDVTDGRGLGGAKNKTVIVRTRIPDILAYRDTPGFAYLLMAANPDASVPVLQSVLDAVGPHQSHPETWMYKRRELFKVPRMPKGVDSRAFQFVMEHMGEPSWKIHKQLRERRIKCSAQQVHRIRMVILYSTSKE
jgi:hypothetical protein